MPNRLLFLAARRLRPQSDSSMAWAIVTDAGTPYRCSAAIAPGATALMNARWELVSDGTADDDVVAFACDVPDVCGAAAPCDAVAAWAAAGWSAGTAGLPGPEASGASVGVATPGMLGACAGSAVAGTSADAALADGALADAAGSAGVRSASRCACSADCKPAGRLAGTPDGLVSATAGPGAMVIPVTTPLVDTVTRAVAFSHGFALPTPEDTSGRTSAPAAWPPRSDARPALGRLGMRVSVMSFPSPAHSPKPGRLARIACTFGLPGSSALANSTPAFEAAVAGALAIHLRNTSLTRACLPATVWIGW